MTDKERITEILKAYTKKHNISASVVILEEYAEELLANGVIVPPCKVGDKIYCLFKHCDHTETEVIEVEIDTFEIHKDYTIINGYCGAHCYRYFTHEVGKTVFLTKEEAEKELLRKEDENGKV